MTDTENNGSAPNNGNGDNVTVIDVNIDDEMYIIHELKRSMEQELGPMKAQYQELEKVMREIMNPYVAQIQECEDRIRSAVLANKTSFDGSYGTAIYTKGYDRVTWDDAKLLGFAAVHPEIVPFRKVTLVAPTVRLAITGDEKPVKPKKANSKTKQGELPC